MNIDVLNQFLISLESYSQDLIQHLRSGRKLCHYTGLDGAIGIITGNDLWLTNSRFSNDDEELRYGHELVDTVLDELDQEAAHDSMKAAWLQQVRDGLHASQNDQVYICCFCEKDNLLSQWRGYADDGGGVSIAFEPLGFTGVAGPDCPHGLMRLWKVFYNRDQQCNIVRACINYEFWPASTDAERLPFVLDALQFFMPTFKNGDFSEERERRLIFTPSETGAKAPQPRFRTRRGMLVPYFSLKELAGSELFRLPVKELTIGPGLHRALNVESSKMMLSLHGYHNVTVRASTTPYRG